MDVFSGSCGHVWLLECTLLTVALKAFQKDTSTFGAPTLFAEPYVHVFAGGWSQAYNITAALRSLCGTCPPLFGPAHLQLFVFFFFFFCFCFLFFFRLRPVAARSFVGSERKTLGAVRTPSCGRQGKQQKNRLGRSSKLDAFLGSVKQNHRIARDVVRRQSSPRSDRLGT